MDHIRTQRRSWTKSDLIHAVKKARSIRQILQILHLKPAGGNYEQMHKYLQYYKIKTKHFKGKGWNKGLIGIGKPYISLKEILKKNSHFQSYKLKKRLFHETLKKEVCEECGWCERSVDGRIPLELHHINGDSHDNRLKNLRILCPNCHSLKSTHRGKNIKRARAGIGRQPTLKMLW